jgi:hypothetical protein
MEVAVTPSADSVDRSIGHDVQKDRLLFEENAMDDDQEAPAKRKPLFFSEKCNYVAHLAARCWKPTLIAYGAVHLIVAAALDFRRCAFLLEIIVVLQSRMQQ